MATPRQIGTLLAVFFGEPAFAEDQTKLRLSLPVLCQMDKVCFIQSYVDVDPGSGIRDYACGTATYEGHNGMDFRLPSAAHSKQLVAVVASADGTIKGVRDGMIDVFAKQIGNAALQERECGNGVVVDHGGGWETQYCHMRQGSVAVKIGDQVLRGQRLGDVGYSGMADFAHLHLTLRHHGKIVDPFSGRTQNAECRSDPSGGQGLWEESAGPALRYAGSQFLSVSFTALAPALHDLERDSAERKPDATSEQLIFFARLLNLRAGDKIRIAVKGPATFEVENVTPPLDRNKATYLAYAGKRRTLPVWPSGHYTGIAQIIRGNSTIAEMQGEITLRD